MGELVVFYSFKKYILSALEQEKIKWGEFLINYYRNGNCYVLKRDCITDLDNKTAFLFTLKLLNFINKYVHNKSYK